MANIARLNHDRHFNTMRYTNDELLVPGGLVLGLTTSNAARDLHEILHEELSECVFPNTLSPGELVSML
jgi:hypothetical protein